MRAVFIESFGGREVLQFGKVRTPEPGPGQVRVAVKAAALNHLDIWVRKGRPGLELKEAHVLGSDAAGVVDAVGEGVTGVAVGDEVVVNPGVSCMNCEYCRRGDHSECPGFRLTGFQNQGTFAEKVVVPACNVEPKPAHLEWHEAAALPLAHLTAWHMLFARARYKPGETVLIHGIGGGVALAALQLVHNTGGLAIVTSSSDFKLEKARELGAAHGINYRTTEDVGAAAREASGGGGVDLCIDTVGAPTLPISMKALRRGGRMVTCGVTGGPTATVNLQMLYWNHQTLMGSTMGSQEDFRNLLRTAANVHLKPVLDRVFALNQYPDAAARMEQGEQFGKIVLAIA